MEKIESKRRLKIFGKINLGVILSWITIFAQIIITIFFTPYLLKCVGDRSYGIYSFSISFLNWLSIFLVAMGSGFGKYVTIAKQEDGISGEKRAIGLFNRIFIIIAASIFVAGLFIIALIYFNVIKLPEYSGSEIKTISFIMLASISCTFVTTLLTSYKGYYYYRKRYALIYLLDLIAIITQTLISFIFLLHGFGVEFIAVSNFGVNIAFSIIQSIISIFFLGERSKMFKLSKEEKRKNSILLKEIILFSVFVIINTLVDNLNKNIDTILLGFFNSDQISVYHLGYTISYYLINFTTIFAIVNYQKCNDVFLSSDSNVHINSIFKKTSFLQLALTFLIVGGFIACGYDFIILWLGRERITVFYIALILMVANSFLCGNSLIVHIRRLNNAHKKAAIIYGMTLLLNIGLSIILALNLDRQYAIWSCAIGSIVATVICQWVLLSIYDSKYTKVKIVDYVKRYVVFFAIGVVFSVIVNVAFYFIFREAHSFLTFFIKGISFTLVYGTIMFLIYRRTTKHE